MKRIRFWLIVILFVLGMAWWLVVVPFAPERLYRAIPSGCLFVSSHKNVAERWPDISQNPISRSLLGSLGVDLKEMDEWTRDPQFDIWMRRVVSEEVVVAYAPYLGALGTDAWVFTSWLGGWSQRLRWALQSSKQHVLEKTGTYGGRGIWTLHMEGGGDKILQMSLVEGVLKKVEKVT